MERPKSWGCRGCSADLRETVRSVDVVIARYGIAFNEDGAAWWQDGEPDWGTAETARFECGECGEVASLEQTAALERALGIGIDAAAAAYYRRAYTEEED